MTVQKLDISNDIIYIKTVNIIYDELKKSVRKLDIVDLFTLYDINVFKIRNYHFQLFNNMNSFHKISFQYKIQKPTKAGTHDIKIKIFFELFNSQKFKYCKNMHKKSL